MISKINPLVDPAVALSYVAVRNSQNDVIQVDANTSTRDRKSQVDLTVAICKAIITELLNDYDVPSVSRMLLQSMIAVLDIKNPEEADKLRSLRRDSLPNLTKN